MISNVAVENRYYYIFWVRVCSRFNLLKPTGHVMHTYSLTFNYCTFCPHCIYVFCIYLRTNSDLCHLQHKLMGFYNRDEKCLLCGTNWVFKWSCLRFVFKRLIIQHTKHMSRARHLWPIWLNHIFPRYLINGTTFGKKVLNIKCVFWFCLPILSETFLILRRLQGDFTRNVHWYSCKAPVIFARH